VKNQRIVVIGSSTVHGRADYRHGGFVQHLRLWHEGRDPKNLVYNLGIWGETTDSLIARLPVEVSIRRPHLIIIYPGLNDTRRVGSRDAENEISIDVYERSVSQLIKSSLDIAPTLVISAFPFNEARTTPYGSSDWYYLRQDAARYIARLKDICAKQGAFYLDIFDRWTDVDMDPLLFEDGLHCNERGHEKLFAEVKNCILELESK
jgi:lysophospholipase L1-like esterase